MMNYQIQTNKELLDRNKRYVIKVSELIDQLPKTKAFNVFSRKLMQCTSSLGNNYEEACRTTNATDYINRLKVAEKEADESVHVLELIEHIDRGRHAITIENLKHEVDELLTIFAASLKSVKRSA